MPSSTQSRSGPSEQGPLRGSLSIVVCLLGAGLATWLTFVVAGTVFRGTYFCRLLTERGYFQHANVFLLWFASAMLLRTVLRSWAEASGINRAVARLRPMIVVKG